MTSSWRPRQNCCHFPDDIFKCIFMNENVFILIRISLKFVPKGAVNNIPSLVQIMAWCWPDDKPLSETIMVNLLMHICVTRLQLVKPSICIFQLMVNLMLCRLSKIISLDISILWKDSTKDPICSLQITVAILSVHLLLVSCQLRGLFESDGLFNWALLDWILTLRFPDKKLFCRSHSEMCY